MILKLLLTLLLCYYYYVMMLLLLSLQWFNLDSLKRRPELISDTYLKLFLTQLQMEGWSGLELHIEQT